MIERLCQHCHKRIKPGSKLKVYCQCPAEPPRPAPYKGRDWSSTDDMWPLEDAA